MDKKEYLKRQAALEAKYEKLDKQRLELTEAYKRDCQPCHKGDIVEITFPGSTLKAVVGAVCDKDFLYSEGEFRPSLVKLRKDGISDKRIYYDGKTPINIKVLGKAPTCSECLWRGIREGKIYCTCAYTGTGEPYYVEPDQMMCSYGNYVRWEGNVPWAQSIRTNIINKNK